MAANSILPVSSVQSAVFSPATSFIAKTGAHGKPTNVKEAATQFEGMLIGEMLHSAHDSNSGSLDGDEDSDSESDTTYSMAADQFAQLMAKQGGFGIAKMLTERLAASKKSSATPGDASHGGPGGAAGRADAQAVLKRL